MTAASARGRSLQPSGPATMTSVEWVWCSDSSRAGSDLERGRDPGAVQRHRLALVGRAGAAVQPGVDPRRGAAAAGEEPVPGAGQKRRRSGLPASWAKSGRRRRVVPASAPEPGRGFPFPPGGSSGDAPPRSHRPRRGPRPARQRLRPRGDAEPLEEDPLRRPARAPAPAAPPRPGRESARARSGRWLPARRAGRPARGGGGPAGCRRCRPRRRSR